MRVLIILLIIGCLNAVPFYGDKFDQETEFVPLAEHQSNRARVESPNEEAHPFDIDVVTSEVGAHHAPDVFFQQSFPFFGQNLFNSFGSFGIGTGSQQEPWWKGPNVCTEKSEDEQASDVRENNENIELTSGISENVDVRPPLFGQFQFSVNSCVEKPNKYVCRRIAHQNGKKKELTITRQCCHGYGRPRNADFATPCDKIEIKNIEEAATELGAKEFIASAKSSGTADTLTSRRNVTIFLPIDSAYASYMEQMQSENNLVESKSDGAMNKLYLRHIVDGEISLEDVVNEQILKTKEDGQLIRINSYQMPVTFGPDPFRYTANCVPIEKHDKLTEQGLVHSLGGVMKPVTRSVMNIIRQRADMSIMRTVLEKTKLSELLEGEKPITIFVPTDDAFDKLEPHFRRALKEGKGCASNILKNHILDLTFCSAASVAGAKTIAYNLLGEPLHFNRSKSTAESKNSEVSDLLGEQTVIINDLAKITDFDIMATNGVVHAINTILPTQSALPLSTLMQEKNVTEFKRLVDAAGLDDKFDDLNNVTFFVPTNKALLGTKWINLLNQSPEKLRDNTELVDFLNYHIVSPMIKTCDMSEKLLPTSAVGSSLRINLYSTHALFSNVMNRATVNCARLVHFDDESCGSVLHQVDKALEAPKMNLLQLLESNSDYSKFLELVRSANLTKLLTNATDGYTLLVPKNDVFSEVGDWEQTLRKDQSELKNLIQTHIVNDVVCCAGIISTNWPFVRTIETLNGAHLHVTRDRRPKIENAGVTKCDNVAINGIIHEINDIIVPARRPQGLQQHNVEPLGEIFF